VLDSSRQAHAHAVSLQLSDDGAGGDVVSVDGRAAVEPDSSRADRVEGHLARYAAAIAGLGSEPGPSTRTCSTAIRVRPTRARVW
jgi:hypothetical protein